MKARHSSPLRDDANEGRAALVTGRGTGTGRATALELAASCARVVVCGRRAEPLERVRNALERVGKVDVLSGLVVFVGFSPLRDIPGFAHASAGRAAVANLASGLAEPPPVPEPRS